MSIADALGNFTSNGNLTAGQLECVQKCLLQWNPSISEYSNMSDAEIKVAILAWIVSLSANFEIETAISNAENTTPTDLTT